MLYMARVAVLNSNRLRKVNDFKAHCELSKAKVLLDNSIRIARQLLDDPTKKRRNLMDEYMAFVILLQSYIEPGLLEHSKKELQDSREDDSSITEAEYNFCQCINAFKEAVESGNRRSICSSPEVEAEYL